MVFLKASISGTILIVCIIVIRMILRNRIPKKAIVFLWCAALCRLMIPFFLPVPMKPQMLHDWLESSIIRTVTAMKIVEISSVFRARALDSGDIMLENAQLMDVDIRTVIIIGAIILVWLIGALSAAFFFVRGHVKWCREYKTSLPIDSRMIRKYLSGYQGRREITVRQSDKIMTPLTYGFLKPVILLPKWMELHDEERLYYVLTHEMLHIRHHDVWKRCFLLAAVCLHWFNPLVWIMCRLFQADMELCCDEGVMHIIGGEARSRYANTLLKMEEKRHICFPLYSCFAQSDMRQRVISIMKYKKSSVPVGVCTTALIAGLSMLFMMESDAQPKTQLITAWDTFEVMEWDMYDVTNISTGQGDVQEAAVTQFVLREDEGSNSTGKGEIYVTIIGTP